MPEATGFDVAFLRIPGSEVEIELLEYHGCEQPVRELAALAPRHRALLRLRQRDRRALRRPLARGVSFRSDGPVEQTAGANAGGKSLYSLDPDGYIIEFHQRPPR